MAKKKTVTSKSKAKKPDTNKKKSMWSTVASRLNFYGGPMRALQDLSRDAKKPGKRKSASGKTYYESRPDRSDLKGQGI